MSGINDRFLIFIPTYNERENIEPMYGRIKKLGLDCDFLLLDDNSPDGTGAEMDRIASKDSRVSVIHRPAKLGIGGAHRDGIRWAYARGYKRLVTMDCDFTHQPEDIALFLAGGESHDVVVGSRFMDRSSLSDWNAFRKFLTYLGHFITATLLGLPYDATGAFRHYRLDRIPREVFDKVGSNGYAFFFESLYILFANRFTIKEVSIRLPARTYGHSKMTVRDSFRSLGFLLSLYFRTLFRRSSLVLPRPGSGKPAPSANDEAEWNAYWAGKDKKGSGLYDALAEFYRKRVIRRALDHFIDKEFAAGAELLHAGCGSGQVDTAICKKFRVTALDISPSALDLYRRSIGAGARVVQGSILRIPAADNAYDGIYNLGVMEHFVEEDIRKILLEFNRVLKPGGKIVLFWPPVFGLSVRVLDATHFVLNNVLRKNVKLHPDEVSRIRSKAHAAATLERAGFAMTGYHFGPRDLFTHSVIVGTKQRHTLQRSQDDRFAELQNH